MTIEKLYKFTDKKTGHFFGYSRHEFPDFCAGLNKEQRDKVLIVQEVTDKKEIEKNTFG